jgi:hypothetical protein
VLPSSSSERVKTIVDMDTRGNGVEVAMRDFALKIGPRNTRAGRGPQEPLVEMPERPLLQKHDRTTLILSHHVERVLANIDADHGDCAVGLLRHGVLLVLAAPGASFCHWRGGSTAGPSH